jgi:hypothetical protein
MEAIMDLYDIPTPTRISPWVGNEKKQKDISGANQWKDPYGPTPYEYWTQEDWRLFRTQFGSTNRYKNAVKKYKPVIEDKSIKIQITFPDGNKKVYPSYAEAGRQTGIFERTIQNWGSGRHKTRKGYKVVIL